MTETELAEQGEVVRGFLVDLLDAFGLDGDVTATPAEEDAVELAVDRRRPRPAHRPEGRDPPGRAGAVPQHAPAHAARARPTPASGSTSAATAPGAGRRSRRFVRTGRRRRASPAARRRRSSRWPRPTARSCTTPSTTSTACTRCPRARTPAAGSSSSPTRGPATGRGGPAPATRGLRRAAGAGPRPGVPRARARSTPTSTTPAVFVAALGGRRTGTVVDLGSGGGVPGLVLASARPDLRPRAPRRPAPSAAAFLEEAVEALGRRRVEVRRGPGRGAGRTRPSRGSCRRRGRPQLRRRRRPPPSAARPLLRLGGRLVVSEPPPPAAARPLAGRRACAASGSWPPSGSRTAATVQVLEQRSALPGRLPPPRRAPGQAPAVLTRRCSTWNTVAGQAWTRGREFHVEHRDGSLRRAGAPGRMQR